MKATIKAILKTRSPLHIAHPDSVRMNGKGGIEYGDKGFPCTAVQKIRIPVLRGDATDGDPQTFNKAYPVIAGNNVAGRLRRYAARHVLKALAKKGQKVSMHTYSVLQCGASTGKPDSEDMTYLEYKTATQHPYFGLMGGGPKMFERKVRVHNAAPLTVALCDLKGTLAHPYAQELALSDQTRFTAVWGFRRNDDLRDLVNMALAEATVEDFEQEFEKRQSLILEDKTNAKANADDADDAAKTQKKSNRNSTMTYSAIEFVIPGVLFDVTMELDVATDAQAGLFLVSLDSFAAEERLGGSTRNGFGVFTFENVQLAMEDGTTLSLFNNGRLDLANPQIAQWLAAWEKEAEAMNARDLDALVAVTQKPEKTPKKKSASEAQATQAA